MENTNISELPENSELVNRLSTRLKKGWKLIANEIN